MSDKDEPLDYERILHLVADATVAAIQGLDVQVAAQGIVENRRPTERELDAARSENQQTHGGGMPEILRDFIKPPPFDPDIARMRRVIDDTLVAARSLLPPSA